MDFPPEMPNIFEIPINMPLVLILYPVSAPYWFTARL